MHAGGELDDCLRACAVHSGKLVGSIDRRRVELPAVIKSIGTYDVSVKLHPEVTAKFKLQVTPAKRRKK